MDYTIIGKIINTHGIKGDLKVYPLTNSLDRFFDLEKVYIGDSKEEVFIKEVKVHKGLALLKFKNLENINDVLAYKEQFVYVDDANKVKLQENQYFISDLIGCKVILEDETAIGSLIDVLQGGANDVYVVLSPDKKEFLIPAVGEFIKSVDIENSLIVIDPIEGMIE
ncbi:MAG: ribosome maturation factor RimM [Gudongella sp.]|nr:ribosome maturation factor RimM [Gudongella sp.]